MLTTNGRRAEDSASMAAKASRTMSSSLCRPRPLPIRPWSSAGAGAVDDEKERKGNKGGLEVRPSLLGGTPDDPWDLL